MLCSVQENVGLEHGDVVASRMCGPVVSLLRAAQLGTFHRLEWSRPEPFIIVLRLQRDTPIMSHELTKCQAAFTVLPHFILRSRQMRPEVARNALEATHGRLSLALYPVISHGKAMVRRAFRSG
jgi:hypothetical protein